MERIKELADDIYRERVLRARAAPPEQKLVDGPQIFERVCRIMADAFATSFPTQTIIVCAKSFANVFNWLDAWRSVGDRR